MSNPFTAAAAPSGFAGDISVDPRDAVISKQAVEIEELNRALNQALGKLQTLDNLLGNARQHTRMHG